LHQKGHPNSTYQAPTIRKILSIAYNALVKILTWNKDRRYTNWFKSIQNKDIKTPKDTALYYFDYAIYYF